MRKVIAADANQMEVAACRKPRLAIGPSPGSSPLFALTPSSTDASVPMRKLSATPVGPACRTLTMNTAATHLTRLSVVCIAPRPPNLLLPWAAPASVAFTASTGISAATIRHRISDWLGTSATANSCVPRNAAPRVAPKPKLTTRQVRNSGRDADGTPWVCAMRSARAHGSPAVSRPAASRRTFWMALTRPNEAGVRSHASASPTT